MPTPLVNTLRSWGVVVIDLRQLHFSTDEEERWRQIQAVGWAAVIKNIDNRGTDHLQSSEQAILEDLQPFPQADGSHFDKAVFVVRGVKSKTQTR
jgi:hypothetical protein